MSKLSKEARVYAKEAWQRDRTNDYRVGEGGPGQSDDITMLCEEVTGLCGEVEYLEKRLDMAEARLEVAEAERDMHYHFRACTQCRGFTGTNSVSPCATGDQLRQAFRSIAWGQKS